MELGYFRLLSYLGYGAGPTMVVSGQVPAISIRRAADKDAPGILACLDAAFAPYRDLYAPAAYLDTILTPETLQERLTSMQVFVAHTPSGQIVGTIACQIFSHGEGHLRGMAILPAWQGVGIAAQLLTRAETELRRQNCTCITLDNTAPLLRAMHFYEKFGFRRSGKITDFFGMPLFEYHKPLASRDTSDG
jgi:ribosomal protein S18 acetylase RimI-like enzyme